MKTPEELVKSLDEDEIKGFAKMGFRPATLLQIIQAHRDNCRVPYLTDANERFLLKKNVLEAIRQRMNKAVENRKITKKAIKNAERGLESCKLTDKERKEKQAIVIEGKTLVEKIDQRVAEMETDMRRLQQEMDNLEQSAVEVLQNIDALMVMGICMMHALDLVLDDFNDEMEQVGYVTTKMPSLLKRFGKAFGEIQEELIATRFYLRYNGKDIWGSKAQTSLHWLTADQLDEFRKQFMVFAAKVLISNE